MSTLPILNKMTMERKIGTRKIHGPEDCPVARMMGCKPNECQMIKMGVDCPLGPIDVEAEVIDGKEKK